VNHPDLDELIGAEVSGAERDRLRHAHELLVVSGPPPEVPPLLERGPTLAMTLGRPRGQVRRRAALLLAAAVAVGIVFVAGYASGNQSAGTSVTVVRTLSLAGSGFAKNASAVLEVQPADAAGNSPMTLVARGLPAPPTDGYYAVWLVRNGKPWGSCGEFVADGVSRTISVRLTAPYQLQKGDSWVVKLWVPGAQGFGRTVMTPVSA